MKLCERYLAFSYCVFSIVVVTLSSPLTTRGSIETDLLAVDNPKVRSLKAARLESSVNTRSLHGCLASNIELHYMDENAYGEDSRFAARVRMSSKLPTVLLEEIEHHLDDVVCSDWSITLQFADLDSRKLAYEELSMAKDFYLVTSHEGCNKEGERTAYRVSEVQYGEDNASIILLTRYATWKDAVHSITMDFGQSLDKFELRRHDGLRRRQAAVSSYAPSVSFSYPATSAPTPTFTSIAKTFNNHVSDKQILPWEGVLGEVEVSGPPALGQITLKCRTCTIAGSLGLLSGSFTMDVTDPSENSTENIYSFYENGYVEIQMNSFDAYFDLETSVQPHESLKIYEAHLPAVGIPGFQIAGIGVVGPILKGQVNMGVQLATQLDFSCGFHVEVPADSSVIFDVGNITNSSVHGFDQTSFTALPFQAHVDSLALTMSMGFQPQLVLGISVFDGIGQIGAGIGFDLPKVSVTVEQVTNVNSRCDPESNHTTGHTTVGEVFDSLTHIVPSLEIGGGLISYIDLDLAEVQIKEDKTWKALTTTWPLPTKCIRFDSHASTYGPPIATSSGSGSAATATGTATTLAALNPFGSLADALGRWSLAFASLIGFCTFCISAM